MLVYYDFASSVNLSYAYQYQHHPGVPVFGPDDDPAVPLAADANPCIKGNLTINPAQDRESAARGNLLNHLNREGQNVLHLDGHVDSAKAPDCGLPGIRKLDRIAGPRGRDNIYKVFEPGEPVDPGTTKGFPKTINLGGKSDSCLVP